MLEKKEMEENCHVLITSPLNEGGRDKKTASLRLYALTIVYSVLSDIYYWTFLKFLHGSVLIFQAINELKR